MLGLEQFNSLFREEAKKLYISMINDNRLDKLDYSGTINKHLNNNKILVLGYSQVSNSTIVELCEDYGFKSNNIELVTNKEKIKDFDCSKLNNKTYDLIIVGQLPHKMRNIRGSNNNVIREIENNIKNHQSAFIARSCSRVRITKESLEKILVNNMISCIC